MAGSGQRMHWIPKLFIAFFGFVLVVNAVMIWLAVSTWNGLETDDAYAKGLAYNQRLVAARRQADLGWTVDLDLTRPEQQVVRIELEASDSFGNLIRDADVRARFVRPVHEGHDFEVALERQPDGVYLAFAELPLAGQWDVEVGLASPRGVYRLEKRVLVEP